MSEHTLILENLESYVAGGLDADEREQLEQHLAECPACAEALEEARVVDQKLETLFAQVRPNPALEDRSIQVLRAVPQRPGALRFPRKARIILTVAAAVLLAAVGAGVSVVIEEDQPGSRAAVINALKQHGLATASANDALRRLPPRVVFGIPLKGDELRDPEKMADEFRDSAFDSLPGLSIHGVSRVDVGAPRAFRDGTSNTIIFDNVMGKVIESTNSSIKVSDPPSTNQYFVEPKAETSVPGIVQSNEPVGIEGRAKAAPPVNLPLPPGLGGGIGGSMESGSPIHYKISGRALAGKKRIEDVQSETKRPDYFKPGDLFERTRATGEQDKKPPDKRPEAGERSPSPDGQQALGEKKEAKGPTKTEPPAQPAASPLQRKIIRSGEIEFEVNSFDAAVAAITRLVAATKGGFIATINSDKLPNGKVCGSVVVRVSPDHLDNLLLDLRKELGLMGELKGQRIGSQDVTKQYIDLESRLKAARTMEERLLKIIRDGKGEIKDLLQAEKQLGVTRTSIEEMEGELRYYTNLISLSTLTIKLTEKSISSAAVVAENERVQTGIEVEDVEKAMRTAQDAVDEAKGRVTKSELKQSAAGQFNGLLHFEVDPTAAGPLRDQLRQLGITTRLEIDRVQQAEGGVLSPHAGKLKRGPTLFIVTLYNVANVAPRETHTMTLATTDVRAAYRKLREFLAKVRAHVVTAQLNEQDQQNVSAKLDFDVRRADEGTLQMALTEAGAVLSRLVTRVPEGDNFTDAKVLFNVKLEPATSIPPREVVILAEEVSDVDATLAVMTAQVKEAQGRVVKGPARGQDKSGEVVATVEFEVPLAAASGVVEKLKAAGQVRLSKITPNPQAPEGKLAVARIDVTLSNARLLLPRDQGLWAQVHSGLSFSLRALSMSVGWLIVGLLFVLPWLLVIYAVFWLARRLWRSPEVPAPAVSAPGSGGATAPGS